MVTVVIDIYEKNLWLWIIGLCECLHFQCMKITIFVLRNFVKRIKKITFSLGFACFRFTEISYFLNFSSNENVRKQHLPANAYFCINMKFPYVITAPLIWNCLCCSVTKTSDFSHASTSTFCWQYLNEKLKFATSYCT